MDNDYLAPVSGGNGLRGIVDAMMGAANSYEYEMIYASPYPPFGEVVDYTKIRMERLHLSWMEYGRLLIHDPTLSEYRFVGPVIWRPELSGSFQFL